MKIALDIDGVLYDFDGTARYILRSYGAAPIPEPTTHWDFLAEHVDPDLWRTMWGAVPQNGLFARVPFAGSKRFVQDLRGVGEVHLVTCRPRSAREDTEWLAEYVKADKLVWVDEMKQKGWLEFDLWVDDCPKVFDELITTGKGNKLIIFDQPWNQGYEGIARAKSFEEVVELAKEKAKAETAAEVFPQYFTSSNNIRLFDTGATRDTDEGKLRYEGFLSPRVLRRFAEYMHKHRVQSDGTLRDPDNWQKGIPVEAYMDSLVRHVMDLWYEYRKTPVGGDHLLQGHPYPPEFEDLLCAIMFNAMGLLHEIT